MLRAQVSGVWSPHYLFLGISCNGKTTSRCHVRFKERTMREDIQYQPVPLVAGYSSAAEGLRFSCIVQIEDHRAYHRPSRSGRNPKACPDCQTDPGTGVSRPCIKLLGSVVKVQVDAGPVESGPGLGASSEKCADVSASAAAPGCVGPGEMREDCRVGLQAPLAQILEPRLDALTDMVTRCFWSRARGPRLSAAYTVALLRDPL